MLLKIGNETVDGDFIMVACHKGGEFCGDRPGCCLRVVAKAIYFVEFRSRDVPGDEDVYRRE